MVEKNKKMAATINKVEETEGNGMKNQRRNEGEHEDGLDEEDNKNGEAKVEHYVKSTRIR
jgi:hypothetical protein